jgi:transcriptional regulator with GAF, ATPase, and Fis domain
VAGWYSALIVRAGACGLTLLAVVVAGIVTADAIRFIGRPWAGFGMLPDGSVAPLALSPVRIGAEGRGLAFDDRIVAVDGVPVADAADVRAVVERAGPDVPLRYTVRRGSEGSLDVVVPTTTFTAADWSELFLPPLAGGLALGLTLGLLPLLARPDLVTTRLFFLANLGIAVNFGFLASDAYVVHHLPRWGFIFTGLAIGSLLHLALLMPQARAPLTTHRWPTLSVIYGSAAAQAGLLAARARIAIPLLACFANAVLSFFIANYALAAFQEKDAIRRRQARVVFASFVALAFSGALLVASTFHWVTVSLPIAVYLVPLWICGGLLAYAMLELNLFDLGGVVRRGLTAGILATGAVGVYLALYLGLRRLVDATTAWAIAGLTAAVLATVVLNIAPVRRTVERVVERALFPGQREARDSIHAASGELARLRDVGDLGRLLREAVTSGFAASRVRLVSGPREGPVEEVGAPPGAAALVLAPGDPLATVLARGASIRFAGGVPQNAARGAADRARDLGVQLAVSLPPTPGHVGGLLLGERTDGRRYTREDERVLETLAAQTAVALENARAWEEVRRLEQRLAAENLYLREEVQLAHDVTGIVGDSEAMRAVLAQAAQVAPTDATIMVEGETGTGKELVVHAIHAASRRNDRALVKIACAALPEQLLESELFGHERGAFTGAVGRKAGRFEVADGGTIFFDDVDTLPLGVQAKLLRALQEGEVQRLGSNEVRRVDVRVIAATNRDLLADVRAGRFREDLYYRLNVVPLRIPPLRERRADIALLVEHFVRQDGQRLGRSTVRAVSSEALEALRAYAWPGNVRELRNVIQRALVLSRGEVLRLPGPLEAVSPSTLAMAAATAASLAEQVRDLKVRLIRTALAESSGNQRIAAERLGMHRQSLTRMIRDLGLLARGARGS